MVLVNGYKTIGVNEDEKIYRIQKKVIIMLLESPNYFPRILQRGDIPKVLNENVKGIIVDLPFYEWTKKSKLTKFIQGTLYQRDIIRDEEEILAIIQEMKENDLIKKVVKKLFTKMGFKNVKRRDYHGAGELGKDILPFYIEREFGERHYYAAQIKATKIHANSSVIEGNINRIITQIQSALRGSFYDEKDNTEKKIDHVYLITSKEITDDARKIFFDTFSGKREAILIDGQTLAKMICQYEVFFDERIKIDKSKSYEKKFLIIDPCTDCLFRKSSEKSQTVKNYLGFNDEIKRKLINDEEIFETDFENENNMKEYILNCFDKQMELGSDILLSPYIPVISKDHAYFPIAIDFLKWSSKLHIPEMPELYGVLCLSEAFVWKTQRNALLDEIKDLQFTGYVLYFFNFNDYKLDSRYLEGYIRLVDSLKKLDKNVIISYSSAFGLILSLFGADIFSSGICYTEKRKRGEAREHIKGQAPTSSVNRYYVRPLMSKIVKTSIEQVLSIINYHCDCKDCQAWNIPHPQLLMMEKARLGFAKHFLHERLKEVNILRNEMKNGKGFEYMSSLLMRAYEYAEKLDRNSIELGIPDRNPKDYLYDWYQALQACSDLLL